MHINAYEVFEEEEGVMNKRGAFEETEEYKETNEEDEGANADEEEEVDPGVNSDNPQFEQDWWDKSSDSNDSIIISFQYIHLHGAKRRYDDKNVLLDTGLTGSVIKNKKMLINAKSSAKTLRAYTNGRHQDSIMSDEFPGFFKVWFNPESRLNIILFKDVRQRFMSKYDLTN